MNMVKMPIVIIAYNRDKSLKRLLDSLSHAYYDYNQIDLIISIDKSNNLEVFRIAKEFKWLYGKKIILTYENNLGLREHVLRCGDIALENDAIIMLEDDLVVSKSFYRYSVQSYLYYNNDTNIAGISLYTYRVNEFAKLRPFTPLQDDSDVYFVMVPSSWGQIWTKKQWSLFKKWYEKNHQVSMNEYQGKVPDIVLNWKESSWKKYFHIYMSEHKKFFVYPRVAYSTNMGEEGTHNIITSNAHQSILMGDFNQTYRFKESNDSEAIRYDSFFESLNIKENLNYDNLMIDYYGTKEIFNETRYLLSVNNEDYEVIKTWGLELVPYELNIKYNIVGNDLFLYDTSKKGKNIKKPNQIHLIKYEIPSITKERAMQVFFSDYTKAIIRKGKKFFLSK